MVFIYSCFNSEYVRIYTCIYIHFCSNHVCRQFLTVFNISTHTNSFSYTSRKALLDRVAFGISRSTLRQQDAKVDIGRLRQRMTTLRARAVELVGEAFAGGAEDPTALQLQADELYGMEEVRLRFLPSVLLLRFQSPPN